MPKSKLLVLDANIVIYLYELNLWQVVLDKYEVHLSRIVLNDEVKYYRGKEQDKQIDLSADVARGKIHTFEVTLSDIETFRQRFGPTYCPYNGYKTLAFRRNL